VVSKKLICIIPARGGSKGLKKKNLKKINGKSLVARTIEVYKKSKYVEKVYVSSECEEILNEAKKYDAIPEKRSINLSEDKTSSEEVLEDFFISKSYVPNDIAIFAQCTSPLITTNDVDKAIEKFFSNNFDSLFSSSEFNGFLWGKNKSNLLIGLNHDEKLPRKRRQDLNYQVIENGGFYIFKISKFLEEKNRFFGKIGSYMTENQHLEIDKEDEFQYAQHLLRGKDFPKNSFKHLFLDFDGVLTDNKVETFSDGKERVKCSKEDSLGLNYLKKSGFKAYILSSEKNDVIDRRAEKLGLELFKGVHDKKSKLYEIISERELKAEEIIYVGNDLNDIDIFKEDFFCCCPKDSSPHIQEISDYISPKKGGDGAVRDICEKFFNILDS